MSNEEIKSIAIGSFDGIHIAHQRLIEQVDAVVVIERCTGYLTPGHKRSYYTDKPLFFYFLDTIKGLGAEEFVQKLEKDFPYLEKIVVGYDFHFGKGREGDAEHLSALFDEEVIIVDEVKLDGTSVHSKVIKERLKQGDIESANKFLGRKYSISGEVIKGQGLGAKELVPTLNLKILNYQLPLEGVYATHTRIGNTWLPSVSFIGHRIITDGSFAVETHIIGEDLGGVSGEVEMEFLAFIRGNKKFDSLEQLKDQISIDIATAEQWSTE